MTWRRVVISKSAKLDFQMGYLVVRQEETHKIHLGEIHTLIVESTATSLTAVLLAELVKQKIKVIFCDEKRLPSSELVPYYGAHDCSAKIRKQVSWTKELKGLIWTEIVAEKIRQQKLFLQECGKAEARLLESYLSEIEFADSTNREGHAAKVYFNALFGLDFTRGRDTPINAALNYGYGIMLSAFSREVVANGYITQLGLFHDNMFNYFNLASDLMEPFRILVDRSVVNLQPEIFDKEVKRALVECMNDPLQINGREETVSNAIKIYCKSAFDALEEQDVSLMRFYQYEL